MNADPDTPLQRIATLLGRGLKTLGRALWTALRVIGGFIVLRALPAIGRWLRHVAWPALHRLYLRLPHRRKLLAAAGVLVALAVSLLLVRPGADQPPATAANAPASATATQATDAAGVDPGEPVIVTLSPAKAPPGAAIIAEGLVVAENDPLEVTVGGQPTSALRLADGRLQLRVPLYLHASAWPEPPKGAQAVEVRRFGHLVARSEHGLEVTELKRAPGSTRRVQHALHGIASAYEGIFESIPARDENERQHRRALIGMLRGLVSEGDRSLAALLDGRSPLLNGTTPDTELIDALLASGGMVERMESFARTLSPTPPSGPPVALLPVGTALSGASALGFAQIRMPRNLVGQPTGPRCRGKGEAYDLACKMQMHGLLEDFAREYVKPTADGYANVMAIVGVPGSPVGANPANILVTALLSVTSFVIDKIAPSLLPSRLSRFELEGIKPMVSLQETIPARVTVAAHNTPKPVRLNDIIDLIKSTLGPAIKLDPETTNKAKDVFLYVIDVYMAGLRLDDAIKPGTSDTVNPVLFTMPPMSWGPIKVEDPDLISLFSYDEPIVTTRGEDMQWLAQGRGQTTLRAMPRGPGERSKVLEDHTLCWGCVWSGGAFGTEMPHSSKPVAVEIELTADPPLGKAPLDVTLSWKLRPREDGSAVPCTLDFGDGTPARRIADCTDTTRLRHTYAYTSRLKEDTGGAFLATLRVDGTPIKASTEVFTEWTFSTSTPSGQAPLDARFSWSIPWPENKQAPACEFDPGDGSKRRRFEDCRAIRKTEHRHTRRGSFVPSLTLIQGDAKDTKTAPVSVAEEGSCDADLLKHKAWRGTVSYNQKRSNVWDSERRILVDYAYSATYDATMPEITRRNYHGRDTLVRYYSPVDRTGSYTLQRVEYDPEGDVSEIYTFKGSGAMLRQTPEMAETGSYISIMIDVRRCIYSFEVQGQVYGTYKLWRPNEPVKEGSGPDSIGGASFEGMLTPSGVIQGSGALPVFPGVRVFEDRSHKPAAFYEINPIVYDVLGPGNLGTASVTWHFEPAD
ncbi:hypothetical protein [Luteimonas sp. e5]